MYRLCRELDGLLGAEVGHCVVLSHRDRALAADVALWVQSSGLEPEIVDDPLLAFARVILSEKLDQSRSAWGLRPGGLTALVICAGAAGEQRDALLDAIEQFVHEAVVCDLADGDGAPAIPAQPQRRREALRLEETDAPDAPDEPVGVGADVPYGLHERRDVIDHEDEADADREDDEPGRDKPLISREEIAMLLGSMDRDDDDRDDEDEAAGPFGGMSGGRP